MAIKQKLRHLRHRRLDGLDRGPGARKRLEKLRAWIARITGALGSTATAISVTVTNATDNFGATAHGLERDENVQVAGTAIPTGLSASTDYYVVPGDADNFKLAASPGGPPIDITDDGTAVTVTRQVDQAAIVQLLRSGITPEQINNASDIDLI
jgi:hypothetical protein